MVAINKQTLINTDQAAQALEGKGVLTPQRLDAMRDGLVSQLDVDAIRAALQTPEGKKVPLLPNGQENRDPAIYLQSTHAKLNALLAAVTQQLKSEGPISTFTENLNDKFVGRAGPRAVPDDYSRSFFDDVRAQGARAVDQVLQGAHTPQSKFAALQQMLGRIPKDQLEGPSGMALVQGIFQGYAASDNTHETLDRASMALSKGQLALSSEATGVAKQLLQNETNSYTREGARWTGP